LLEERSLALSGAAFSRCPLYSKDDSRTSDIKMTGALVVLFLILVALMASSLKSTLDFRRTVVSGRRSAGSFPEQWLVIEPTSKGAQHEQI